MKDKVLIWLEDFARRVMERADEVDSICAVVQLSDDTANTYYYNATPGDILLMAKMLDMDVERTLGYSEDDDDDMDGTP
ncbi:MAG: hypothetical protein II008_11785 [Oscillospiraceae bacterium]|nr:hypothetical protein [Oscillospiraceae bacterium]